MHGETQVPAGPFSPYPGAAYDPAMTSRTARYATLAVAGLLAALLLQPETAAGAKGLYDTVIASYVVVLVDQVSTVLGCF